MTHSVPKDWLEKTYESTRSTGVRPELPIGAPPKAHLLWDRGRCVIAFSCYRWEMSAQMAESLLPACGHNLGR